MPCHHAHRSRLHGCSCWRCPERSQRSNPFPNRCSPAPAAAACSESGSHHHRRPTTTTAFQSCRPGHERHRGHDDDEVEQADEPRNHDRRIGRRRRALGQCLGQGRQVWRARAGWRTVRGVARLDALQVFRCEGCHCFLVRTIWARARQ